MLNLNAALFGISSKQVVVNLNQIKHILKLTYKQIKKMSKKSENKPKTLTYLVKVFVMFTYSYYLFYLTANLSTL